MELSPVQRTVSFLAVVIVLAGLGVYLFLPAASGAGRPAAPAAGLTGRSPAPSRPQATATQGSASPASASPASGSPASASPASAPDIYRWLPFSQAGLSAAASVTVRFAADYGTFSYTQSPKAYLAPMRTLVTAGLAQVLGRAFATPGLAAARTSQRQNATATATISALRSFGPASLTFLVTITQRIAGTAGTSKQVGTYAVTLTGSGTSWQVSDIELAAAGNQ